MSQILSFWNRNNSNESTHTMEKRQNSLYMWVPQNTTMSLCKFLPSTGDKNYGLPLYLFLLHCHKWWTKRRELPHCDKHSIHRDPSKHCHETSPTVLVLWHYSCPLNWLHQFLCYLVDIAICHSSAIKRLLKNKIFTHTYCNYSGTQPPTSSTYFLHPQNVKTALLPLPVITSQIHKTINIFRLHTTAEPKPPSFTYAIIAFLVLTPAVPLKI